MSPTWLHWYTQFAVQCDQMEADATTFRDIPTWEPPTTFGTYAGLQGNAS